MRKLLFLALLVPLLASAQEKRTCRILFLNPPPDAPKKLFLFDGEKSQEIELPEMNFSDVYQVAGGDATIRLLSKAVAKAEEVPADAPGGRLAAAVDDFYIIATGDPANKTAPVKIQIIDAGSQKFRKGQMMWYNLTPNAVGGTLGSQKLAMKAQSRVIVDAPAAGNEAFEVTLSYTIPNDNRFHPICQTQWVHDARSRMVVFVHGGADNTTPQISGFKDFRITPEKAE
ncbi:MAG: hypothetical protein V4584_04535 [Verrucomicrobiota bacterium]